MNSFATQQISQVIQLFSTFELIFIQYPVTVSMAKRKNVNNDVSKDSPIQMGIAATICVKKRLF